MPRLFSGIEIPADIALRLSLAGAPLAGARWSPREDLHLSLYFAGDISNDVADEWASRLALIDVAAFNITIAGLGIFGKNRPRSLWAAIEPNQALLDLASAHREAARLCGMRREVNPYKPHITLARFNGTSKDALSQYLADNANLRCAPFTARTAALFSARPHRGGGPFSVEQRFGFLGADPEI